MTVCEQAMLVGTDAKTQNVFLSSGAQSGLQKPKVTRENVYAVFCFLFVM